MATGVRSVHEVMDRIDASMLEAPSGVNAKLAATLLGEVDRAIGRLQGLRLMVVAAADRSRAGASDGYTGTGAWLAATSKSDQAAAAREVSLAAALADGDLDATRDAVTSGYVSPDKAGIIAHAMSQLPVGLSPTSRQRAEAGLVDTAASADPRTLRKAGRQVLRLAQDEVDERAARDHEASVLGAQERDAYARSRLTLFDNGDGTTTGSFTLPTTTAAILAHVVQQMTSPRRAHPDVRYAGGAATGDACLASTRLDTDGSTSRRGGDTARQQGRALVELIEHLPTDHLHGKVAATVVVTIDEADLTRRLAVAHQDTGDDLTAGEARRLACNAGILPVVLGGQSLPLDLGRQERFFTEHQRVALATRYDTCAAQGCDRPYSWSELHHEHPWHTGGATDLERAVPLCGFHHRRVHDPTHTATISTDPDGRKHVLLRQIA